VPTDAAHPFVERIEHYPPVQVHTYSLLAEAAR
jgi:hypothetical protein